MPSPYNSMHDARAQVVEIKAWAQKKKRMVLTLAVVVLAGLCLMSSYYQVEPDEVGVLLRFGKYIGTSDPGPHFKLPFGIDTVTKVPQRTLKMEFGFRTSRPNQMNRYERTGAAEAESVVLTGDLNVGIVEWIIQYRITSPEKYLFSFRDIHTTMRLVSEAAVRAIVGDHSIDELLTSGREEIENKAKDLLVEMFARYDIGVTVQQLKLQEANVPDRVRPALTSVEEAKQERERSINEAWAEYNQEVPRARGAAERTIQAAEGYAVERLNRATGDAERFRVLYNEYKKAPDVTRTRLYLEALSDVLPRTQQKIVVDTKAKSILPLLNLGSTGERP